MSAKVPSKTNKNNIQLYVQQAVAFKRNVPCTFCTQLIKSVMNHDTKIKPTSIMNLKVARDAILVLQVLNNKLCIQLNPVSGAQKLSMLSFFSESKVTWGLSKPFWGESKNSVLLEARRVLY